MSSQKKQLLISPTSSTASRFYLQSQENQRLGDRNQIKELDNDDSNMSEISSSLKEFDSSDQTPDPDNFFYHYNTTPARRVTKKEVLLGQASHIDILGRKSYIKTENSKPRNMPESLFEIPNREQDQPITSQQTEILLPKPLKTLFRRKSCACTCCGGSSALERKIQDLPGFPIPRNAKQMNPTFGNLDDRGTMNNLSLIRNKHESSSKSREKGYGKNGVTLKSIAFQAKNTMEGLTPTNVQRPVGTPNYHRGDSGARTMYLESKQHSLETKTEIDEKGAKLGKETGYQGQHTLHHIDESLSKNEMTALAVENKNQIAHLLKKKLVKRKRGIEGNHSTKQLYYSNLRMETFFKTFNSVIPKLKLESLLKARKTPLEKTEEVPQELEEEKNIKSVKARLGKITGQEGGKPVIKKLNGMAGRNVKEQSKLQTSHNTSNSYVLLTDRSRSLPVNKIPEGLKASKHSMDKGSILSPLKPQNQVELKQKRPKLKLKKLDISGGFVVNNGVQSVRSSATTTPKGITFKVSESARIKSTAKNEWLIKNYNTKMLLKKDQSS